MLAETMVKTNSIEKSEKVSRRTYSVNSVNKDEKLYIRMTEEEKAKLQAAANRKGISMSKLVMDLVSLAYL